MKKPVRSGFTLVELLIVVGLIGSIAGFVMLSYPASLKRGRDTQRKSDIKQYQTSFEVYATKNGGFYPSKTSETNLTDLDLCATLGLTNCVDDPKSPVSRYKYRSNGDGLGGPTATEYVSWTTLEAYTSTTYWVICSDGKTGTATTKPISSTCPALQ